MRDDVGEVVPVTIPGENTTLLFGPSGWHVAGTSSWTMLDVSQRPALLLYFSGTGSNDAVRSVMSTRRIRSIRTPFVYVHWKRRNCLAA